LIVDRKLLSIAATSLAAAILIATAIVVVRLKAQHSIDPQPVANLGDMSDEAAEEAARKAAEPIDPAAITYHETLSFPVTFREARALAVDDDCQIYVGGDRTVIRYAADGKKRAEIALQAEPRCLAVGAPDSAKPTYLYVGMEEHVEVYDPQGARVAVWPSCGPEAIFTSIAATKDQVWAADAGNRLVWRFDPAGKLLGSFGKPDPAHNRPGFMITSHYFDLAAASDGLVYVVNPRRMAVEGYSEIGEYLGAWGKGSPAVADFFGCCNPAQLAVLPDGRFVTAEKGLPRVKVYSIDGKFQTVVAGPAQLLDTPVDLAADHNGRVLVLDGRPAKVRVFEKNSSDKGEKQ
jgi:hypothetical protein